MIRIRWTALAALVAVTVAAGCARPRPAVPVVPAPVVAHDAGNAAPKAAAAGCIVIDNSSAWRMDRAVPLVVPGPGSGFGASGLSASDVTWKPNALKLDAVILKLQDDWLRSFRGFVCHCVSPVCSIWPTQGWGVASL